MHRMILSLLMACYLLAGGAGASEEDKVESPDPIGVWRGELELPGAGPVPVLKLVLRIRHGGEGQLAATLEGLVRGQPAIALESLVLVEDVLGFQVPQVEARYAGNFYGDSLRGTWTQGEVSRALFFYRD